MGGAPPLSLMRPPTMAPRFHGAGERSGQEQHRREEGKARGYGRILALLPFGWVARP